MNACMQGTLPSIVPNNKTRIYTQNCLVNTDAKRVSITETIISENTLNQGIHAWVTTEYREINLVHTFDSSNL